MKIKKLGVSGTSFTFNGRFTIYAKLFRSLSEMRVNDVLEVKLDDKQRLPMLIRTYKIPGRYRTKYIKGNKWVVVRVDK